MTNSKKTKKKNPRPEITEDIFEMIQESNEGEEATDGFSVVLDEFIDDRRWVNVFRKVFTDGKNHYWAYYYETPKTEYQEGSENKPTLSDVHKVKARTVTTVVYR